MPSWHVDNYWTPENPDAFLPRYTGYYAPFYGGHKNANTRYLMNAAYLRLKNIQVGYNLPSEWIKKLHLTNVGIYLSGENLLHGLRFTSIPRMSMYRISVNRIRT